MYTSVVDTDYPTITDLSTTQQATASKILEAGTVAKKAEESSRGSWICLSIVIDQRTLFLFQSKDEKSRLDESDGNGGHIDEFQNCT